MDECTPRHFDVAQLRFLCESLYKDSLVTLDKPQSYLINDPTGEEHLALNDLIEHIANFTINYKIKYFNEVSLTTAIDSFLDETFMLAGNCGITSSERIHWQAKADDVFSRFSLDEHPEFS